ncbi:hypothetical protein U1707_04765 [Sphingomonas sp. PB2P12]|uniref:hypothetical protein n=1 Tax=Sphingomonas sandaracina TaxID=3096157 RepID=UPI002FC5EF71
MSPFILKSLIVVTALVSAAPILAAGGSQPTTELKYDARTQKYCVTDAATTGSRLRHTTCKTATQWSAEGLDMPKRTVANTRMPVATITQD